MVKLRTLQQVMPHGKIHDSVALRKKRNGNLKKNAELVHRAQQAWNDLEDVRLCRERTKNYVYGDQWGDIIYGRNGAISERKLIQSQGNVPLSNNIMISILNSVVGLYAKQGSEPVAFARTRDAQSLSDMMSATLQANWQDTKVPDVLRVIFQDCLSGGVMLARDVYEDRGEDLGEDDFTDYVNPSYAFWKGGSDPRHIDLRIIGMLHDCSRDELYSAFANNDYNLSVDDINEIFHINEEEWNEEGGNQFNDRYLNDNVSFSSPSEQGLYRVIEVWTKETKERYQCYDPIAESADTALMRIEIEDIGNIRAINEARKAQYEQLGVPKEQRAYIRTKKIIDSYWYYTFMASDGTVLCEGETPYEHHSHPFILKLYPFINGEIHPFMTNVIDQQRYINRLIVMHDMAARSAAKGITIIPKSCLGDLTPEQFAEEWTEYDGLVFYEPSRTNPNLRPEVITSNSVQIGTYELLQLQLTLAREITNVSGALQGKTPSAGTSASRYAQEAQNATTSLYALLQDASSFTEAVARKKCANIKQFYRQGRLIFNQDNTSAFGFDRMATRDVMYKISIKEAGASASYQMQANEMLKELLQQNRISTIQFLKQCNLPFADSLLQQLESDAQQQELAQQQQMQQMQQLSPEQQQQVQGNTQRAQQLLKSA